MRFARRSAAATAAVALTLALPYEAWPHARVANDGGGDPPASQGPFGAECRLRYDGSEVTAYCHNPYPEPDRVSLHIECARWWDLDSDGRAVEAGPAQTVRLTGRCWERIGSAWVSHRRTE
ncbi:hypothetical protein [Streptomyces ziwulingensis]|uniref:Secreted protein n=1 Tax=Streptomyces ziwulingensis TaxID=1045501 RepID=A0ABP9BNM9_9ACTN